MHVYFKRDALLKPLAHVATFIERKHTLNILANAYISKQGDSLVLVGSDSEIQITVTANGIITGDDFTITLPAKKVVEILKALPEQSEVKLSINGNKAILNAGKAKFSLQCLPEDEYPLLNIKEEQHNNILISESELAKLLTQVQYAIAVNDSRIHLNGLLIEIKNNTLILVATDAHRLNYACFPLQGTHNGVVNATDISAIIPRKTILELSRLLGQTNNQVMVRLYPNYVLFELENKQVITKVIAGSYVKYERAIPLHNDKLCLINRELFLRALQRVAVIGMDKLRNLCMELKHNTLILSCHNEEQETAYEELEVIYDNVDLQLNFNISYVLDVLTSAQAEYLQWAFYDNERAVLITIPNNISFKYVIMPLRI